MKRIEIEKQRGTNSFVIHANFLIPKHDVLLDLVHNIEGVEAIDLLRERKYSFLVSIGRLFDTTQVTERIKTVLLAYHNEQENE
ncbi:hypothetical protein ACMA1I_17785 [Pontibacter sp. 13R65]|uniref:hypothetical protein n=1 Tax=Pontibacter sp. 13R65 TaxID=3127458 RepID=UPI00301DD282